jgi:hypothetical protein
MRKIVTLITVSLMLMLITPPIIAKADTIATFISDSSWDVYTGDPYGLPPVTNLGAAQTVSLSGYGYVPPVGWGANLSPIVGASWIWAPGITGSTTSADLDSYYFSKHFAISVPEYSGSIYLAADDFAEVIVNGHIVGSVGSTTDYSVALAAQNSLVGFDISPWLTMGSNTITIYASNGSASFVHGVDAGGNWDPNTYSLNTAGVVFGGTLEPYAHAPVPEPSTMMLLGSGLAGLIGYGRRRLKK